MFRKSENLKENKGMALVMSLLIMSLIMVSALAFSRIIFGEVRMSLNVINSIGSFYAADAGMEKALYYLKYAKSNSDLTNFEGLIDDTDVSFASNQSFKVVVASSTYMGFTAYDIATSSPAQVDIIDPVGDVSNIEWSDYPTNDYTIEWYIDSCFPDHASDRLEVGYTSFASNFANPQIDKNIIVCNCGYDSADKCSAQVASYSIEKTRYYSFSFRPLDDSVSRLDFNLNGNDIFDNDYDLGILSQMAITVDGAYKNSKFRLKANLPAISPLSGVFSYVIFSEEPLIKDL